MLSEEEKKAIDKINRQITIGKCGKNIGIPVYIHDLETLLNLIEKQQAEIKEQQEIIDSTEETISGLYNDLENASWRANQKCKIIKKKEAQIEKKDKIIDEMAYQIAAVDDNLCEYIDITFKENKCRAEGDCHECIKNYFIKKVEQK